MDVNAGEELRPFVRSGNDHFLSGMYFQAFLFFFILKFRVWGMEYVMQAVCNKVAFCHTTSTYTKQLFKCEESHMSVWGGCISHLNTHRVR